MAPYVVTSEALGTCVNDLPRVAARQCGAQLSNLLIARPVLCAS